LHVVHVHVPPPPINVEGVPIMDPPIEQAARQREQAYLDEVVQRMQKATDVPLTATLLEGAVAEAVHEQADKVKADLVVLTTHGRGAFSRFWLGSVADQLVRRLPMPVLLLRPYEAIPDFTHDVAFRRVLVALDGSPFAEEVLPPATALGTLTRAEFILLRVIPPLLPGDYDLGQAPLVGLGGSRLAQLRGIQEESEQETRGYLDRLAAQLCKNGLSVQSRVACHDSPAAAILEEADRIGADLISLATHGRGGLARMFLGSVADKVVRGATIPVLIHRPSHP
jgi:nucleotide-binding universal stress UspA family protein